MKQLKYLLEGLSYTVLQGKTDVDITDICYGNRDIKAGALFICVRGGKFDGYSRVSEAIEKGAAAILTEEMVEAPEGVALVQVSEAWYAAAFVSAAWFDHPAGRLTTIGITGTKGKTTTAYMVKAILENAGHKVGLIGTIEVIIGEKKFKSRLTTPPAYFLQKILCEMVKEGCDTVVMEVSSYGLMLHRTQGFLFDYGVFTNITPNHISSWGHRDFDHYLSCKAMLFRQCRVGIVNRDDANLEKVLAHHTCEIETYGISEKAELFAGDVCPVKDGETLGITYHVKGAVDCPVELGMPGRYNIYNSLAAIAVCRHFHVQPETISRGLKAVRVKGRTETVKVSDKFILMIDHAHNPMSLEKLLTALREYDPDRLVCLFGCGGNLDRPFRYEMGEVSGRLADFTVITSDNPMDDDPQVILDDIRAGLEKTNGKYVEIMDRKKAIACVIRHAKPGDIIVLAGKGHEDYQEIKGKRFPMDERILIAEILKENDHGLYHREISGSDAAVR